MAWIAHLYYILTLKHHINKFSFWSTGHEVYLAAAVNPLGSFKLGIGLCQEAESKWLPGVHPLTLIQVSGLCCR